MLALAVPGVVAALFVWKAPQSALYNTRVLPLWWLCVYLVAGYAVAEVLVMAARGWRSLRDALRWAPPPPPVGVVPGGPTPAFATGGPVSTFAPHVVPGTEMRGLTATTDVVGRTRPARAPRPMPRPGYPGYPGYDPTATRGGAATGGPLRRWRPALPAHGRGHRGR